MGSVCHHCGGKGKGKGQGREDEMIGDAGALARVDMPADPAMPQRGIDLREAMVAGLRFKGSALRRADTGGLRLVDA